MIPIPLITLGYAKAHIRLSDTCSDNDLSVKLFTATQLVMRHIKLSEIPGDWLSSDFPADSGVEEVPILPAAYSDDSPPTDQYVLVPGSVQIGILLVTAELFTNRESSTANPMSDTVIAVLTDYRIPTLGMADRAGFEEEEAEEAESE